MRRERKPSSLRGVLLFLLGALVGANAVYFVMSRDDTSATSAPAGSESQPGRVEIPLPIEGTNTATASQPTPTTAALPPPRVIATGTGASPANAGSGLLVPVQGVTATQLLDTFTDSRSEGRSHDAIDIMAAAGTPGPAGQSDASYRTTLLAEPRSNSLIVRAANPARLALVRSLVAKLDQAPVVGSSAATGNSFKAAVAGPLLPFSKSRTHHGKECRRHRHPVGR